LSRDLIIQTVSNDYLHAVQAEQGSLLGCYLFDAFPDNPAALEAHSVQNLRASLEQVLATG
jgi:hypothetical protein